MLHLDLVQQLNKKGLVTWGGGSGWEFMSSTPNPPEPQWVLFPGRCVEFDPADLLSWFPIVE